MPLDICVDFDGTLADHRYPDIGPPVPGAIEWAKRFAELGARLILWTMRSDVKRGSYLTDAVEWCRSNGLEFWSVGVHPEQHEWTTSRKALADLYIDDAAVCSPLIRPVGFRRPCLDWSIVGPIVEAKLLAQLETNR